MGETFEPVQLRPLGIGEIFDRAVTLYVRNFLLFAIISAFVVVPLSIVNYFALVQQMGTFAQILDQIQHPARTPAAVSTPFGLWFAVLILISFLVTPFMYVAMAAALGRIYNGEQTDWRSAYGVALRHAGGIVLTAVCQAAILLILAFTGMFGLALAFVAAFVLVRFAAPLGVVMVIVAILLAILYFIALMLCYLAIALSFDAIGIEETSFVRAISSGFARVFNRSELGKATLVCLAFAAVQLALVIISAVVGGTLEAFLHQRALQAIVSGLISILTTGFIGVLLAVYYFDVRVRREGLDMLAAIERLQAPT